MQAVPFLEDGLVYIDSYSSNSLDTAVLILCRRADLGLVFLDDALV